MTTTPETLKPLLWESKNLVRAIEAAGVTLWSWNVDTDAFAMDDHSYDLWGIPRGVDVAFEDLSAHIHPADRDRVRAAFTATRTIIYGNTDYHWGLRDRFSDHDRERAQVDFRQGPG